MKVILLLSYDYHFQDKQEEDYKLFQRVSYGAVPLQMFLTFLSSINGYNASVAGHFSAEAKNSFQQIIDFFSNLKHHIIFIYFLRNPAFVLFKRERLGFLTIHNNERNHGSRKRLLQRTNRLSNT